MEVDEGPLPFSQGDELDDLLYVATNLMPFFFIKLNVAVPEEQVVMDSFLVFANRLDDVTCFELAVRLDELNDAFVPLCIYQMLVPTRDISSWLLFVLTVLCFPWDYCRRA